MRRTNPAGKHRPVIETRRLGQINQAEFNMDLANTDWSAVYTADDPTNKWTTFAEVFTSILDAVAPVRRVRAPPPAAPPVTDRTRQLLHRRRAALAAGHPARADYKELNRQCRAAIRRDYREDLTQRINEAGQRRVWHVLRPVIGSKKGASVVPNVSPNDLNHYFVNVGPQTAASVPPPRSQLPVRLPRVASCGFRIMPVSSDDLCITLGSMKSSGTVDVTGFSVSILQKFFYGLQQVLLNIINASLISGSVPSQWKHGIVVPIPKGGDASKPANWRPVTILPAIMKITERLVHRQLNNYLNSNFLYVENQHGYRRNHSTETALTVVTDRVYRAMDEGKVSILVLLDLSKCFDVICHKRLLEKFELYGIDTHWFLDYLKEHRQQVKINSSTSSDTTASLHRGPNRNRSTTLSDPLSNTCGVFQGGSLSCLMWSIFANDMSLYIENSSVIQFCDDTQLLISGKKQDLPAMVAALENDVDRLLNWFSVNSLKINAKKTQIMLLGTRQMLHGIPTLRLKVGDTIVSESREVKNLGVHMDRHLTYETHIDQLTSKCTGFLICLIHAKHTIPSRVLKLLVQALVISSVRYCISIYGTCGTTQLNRIQKIINFCARVISGKKKHDHISQEVQRLGFLNPKQLATYHQLCLTKTVLDTNEPKDLRDIFEFTNHDHNTRQVGHIRPPRARTNAGQR